MITNARFVSVYVKDQERALDFWTNKLGFEVIIDSLRSASPTGGW